MATWLPLFCTFSLHTASAATLGLQQSNDRSLNASHSCALSCLQAHARPELKQPLRSCTQQQAARGCPCQRLEIVSWAVLTCWGMLYLMWQTTCTAVSLGPGCLEAPPRGSTTLVDPPEGVGGTAADTATKSTAAVLVTAAESKPPG